MTPSDAGDAPPDAREFTHAGRTWTARLTGAAMAGTGRVGFGVFEAVHFFPAGQEHPAFEALVPRGRFPHLFDAELAELLHTATPIPPAEPRRG